MKIFSEIFINTLRATKTRHTPTMLISNTEEALLTEEALFGHFKDGFLFLSDHKGTRWRINNGS